VELFFLNRCTVVKAQREFQRAQHSTYRQSHIMMDDINWMGWFSDSLEKVRSAKVSENCSCPGKCAQSEEKSWMMIQ
jgi:hypothetical protein